MKEVLSFAPLLCIQNCPAILKLTYQRYKGEAIREQSLARYQTEAADRRDLFRFVW